jgi:hypothetical protein
LRDHSNKCALFANTSTIIKINKMCNKGYHEP